MSYTTFPADMPFSKIRRTPHFDVSVVGEAKSQQRILWDPDPDWEIVCQFDDIIEDDIADQIMAFFCARSGPFQAFYFRNPEEAYRGVVWQPNHAYLVGQIVRPVTATGHAYRVTTAGTSGASEPAWPTTEKATVTDGAGGTIITWTENTYLVRFKEALNQDYLEYRLYTFGEVTFVGVTA